MREEQKWCVRWAATELLYLAVAAWNFWEHRGVLGGILLLTGWAVGSALLYENAQLAALAEVDEELSEIIQEHEKSREYLTRAKEMAETMEAEAEARGIHAIPMVVCRSCGGTIWTEIGGEMQCIRCGAALPEEKTEE